MKRFCLPRRMREQLLARALATPTREVCGLIGGHGARGTSLYAVTNVADRPEVAFLMEPQGQLRAMKLMRERGEDLVGIFHSHPRTDARPSLKDLAEAAYPYVAYLIISLQPPERPTVGAFVYDGKAFNGIELRETAAGYDEEASSDE